MSVNRYECGLTNAPTEYQSPTMYQDENGGYVSYEDYTTLEAKCAALAAENAALKATSDDRRMFIMNGVQLGYIKVPTVETDPALETIRVAVSPQEPTPATDSFLAEVRAQESKRIYESILDNPAVTDMGSLVDWLEQNANDSISFAAQLRQEAQ